MSITKTKDMFAIQVIESLKWVGLDYTTGNDIIFVDSFIDAYSFNSKNDAIDFIYRNFLNINDYELFKIEYNCRTNSMELKLEDKLYNLMR